MNSISFPYYRGLGPDHSHSGRERPLPQHVGLCQPRPERYLADQGLVDAVNVALVLGQPLLLTGEPGTGKTQLGYHLAWELGLGDPLKFETKSNSVSRDLFYSYNTLGRFHAAQTNEGSQNPIDYITYNALGRAILLTKSSLEVLSLLPPQFMHNGATRSVVLIDEVDKAPRDFPNDILNEIEGMYFRIPEFKNTLVEADPVLRPIVVITSNSEKHLPDAFLRRCIFYHIDFPDRDRLEAIVSAHFEASPLSDDPLKDYLDLFQRLRARKAG